MAVIIDPGYIDSVRNLSTNEMQLALNFVSKFCDDSSRSSISLERLERTRNRNVWSGRINDELRAIIFKDGDISVLLHADHHDPAYAWAERRKIGRNTITGDLEVIKVIERIEEVVVPSYKQDTPKLFDNNENAYLLSLGLPEDYLPAIREFRDLELLWDFISSNLPEDIANRLLSVAMGDIVAPPTAISLDLPLTAIPENQRRFFIIENDEEFQRMLEAPMEKWISFLHPSQKSLVKKNFNGPAKITGSAGTGKTVVAMHRAKYLASQGKKVFFTTYVTTLCKNLERNLKLLCSPQELANIKITSVHSEALELLKSNGIRGINPVSSDKIKEYIERFYESDSPLNINSLLIEWESVIKAQNITSWEEYRDNADRRGRGIALKDKDKKKVWKILDRVSGILASKSQYDWSSICKLATDKIKNGSIISPYDTVIVDEVQDLKPLELEFLTNLAKDNKNNLLLVGDSGQRIYSKTFSFNSLGINVRGRSHILKINYRTTEQIRKFADSLLDSITDDLDGGNEARNKTRSLLRGPKPTVKGFENKESQTNFVIDKIKSLVNQGLLLGEIAIFARTKNNLDHLESELSNLQIKSKRLSNEDENKDYSCINLGTMHRAKGLEFKVVFVIDVSDEYMPYKMALRNIIDPIDKNDEISKEKSLFYVSITRARDEVFITWSGNPSSLLSIVENN